MPGVRAWGDEHSDVLHQDLVLSIRQESPGLFPRGSDGAFQYNGLSLSGGGDHGAFGAGFLAGWTASGTRPRFKIVAGTSTGALIAPFALLGSEYDDVLKAAYTTVSAGDIFESLPVMTAYWRESLSGSHPLQAMVQKIVNDEVVDAVARAHRTGQRLFVSTTNLDAQRPVIWNMGMIANSGRPERYDLFRKVLLASAAIPILFPPVYFDVETTDSNYEEMHVDGGTVGQMFFYGSSVDWRRVLQDAAGVDHPTDRSTLRLIVDGKVSADYTHVRRRLPAITDRTIKTLIKVSAWSSLYRMYIHAEIGGYGFRYVGLPGDYESISDQPYDSQEMTRLFNVGFEMGKAGESWRTLPPGF